MRDLYIAFSRPRKFKVGSTLIRLVERTPFSHCLVKWNSHSLNETILYHAHSKGGLNFISTEIFNRDHKIVELYKIQVTPDQMKRIMRFCIQNAGKEYGTLQLVGIAYVRILNFFKRKARNPFPMGQVCSELIVRILHSILDVRINLDPNVAGPQDLKRMLISMEAEKVWPNEDLNLKN